MGSRMAVCSAICLVLTLVLSYAFAGAPPPSQIWYVHLNGSTGSACGDTIDPCQSIMSALVSINSSTANGTVTIAIHDGDYYGPNNTDIVLTAKTLPSAVTYMNITSVSTTQWSVTLNASAVSRIFSINWNVTTHFYGITFASGNGTSKRSVFGGTNGGAVYAVTSSELVFDSCTFQSNIAHGSGGAVFWNNSAETSALTTGWFMGNQAGGNGGALYATGSAINITGGMYNGNSAEMGGAIFFDHGVQYLTTSSISLNAANYGGGIAVNGTETPEHMPFTDLLIMNNTAFKDGGGIFDEEGNLETVNLHIMFNNAGNKVAGGGIALEGSLSEFYNCQISQNNATNIGGGVYSRYGEPEFVNCTIAQNMAADGSGLFCNASEVTSIATNFTGNSPSADIDCYLCSTSFINALSCPANDTFPPTTPPPTTHKPSPKGGLSGLEVFLIIVGILAFVGVVAGLGFYGFSTWKRNSEYEVVN